MLTKVKDKEDEVNGTKGDALTDPLRHRVGEMMAREMDVSLIEASFIESALDDIYAVDRRRFNDNPARMEILYKAVARTKLPEAAGHWHRTIVSAEAIRKLAWDIAAGLVWRDPSIPRSEAEYLDSVEKTRKIPSDFPDPDKANRLVDEMVGELGMQGSDSPPFISQDLKDVGAFLQDVFVTFETKLQTNGYELISKGDE
jgi:hypothetical protein